MTTLIIILSIIIALVCLAIYLRGQVDAMNAEIDKAFKDAEMNELE